MYLVFDVEISCDQSATYHSDLQIYLDYNTNAFGNNIATNGNIAFERLDLLQGDIGGTNMYTMLPPGNIGADNMEFRHALLTEAQFQLATPMFMKEVPVYPDWASLVRYRLLIEDPSELAGIQFVAEDEQGVPLMNFGQYFLDGSHAMPAKYGVAPGHVSYIVNDLLDFPLMLTETPEIAEISSIEIYSYNESVFIETGTTEAFVVTVYDLPGKVIFSEQLVGSTKYKINPEVETGVYIVETTYQNRLTSKKVHLD